MNEALRKHFFLHQGDYAGKCGPYCEDGTHATIIHEFDVGDDIETFQILLQQDLNEINLHIISARIAQEVDAPRLLPFLDTNGSIRHFNEFPTDAVPYLVRIAEAS